jgi:hypothetical protein
VREGDPAWDEARRLGHGLATRGARVMTGGYDGVMAACSRGAHEAGGHVIGVTVEMFERRGPVNPWVHERIHTPDLHARLALLVARADGFVVATGSIGTLTELFLSWTLLSVAARPPAPLVLMGGHWHAWVEAHRGPRFIPDALLRHLEVAATPEAAVAAVFAGLTAPVPAQRPMP